MPLLTLLLSFLKKIPTKDLLYSGAIVAASIWFIGYTHHERSVGAQNLQTAISKANTEALASNAKRLKELADKHANDVAIIEDNYEKILQSADAQHNFDLNRLQQYVSRSGKATSVPASSACSSEETDSWRERFEGLGQISAELADALRKDDAALKSCYAERESLTVN